MSAVPVVELTGPLLVGVCLNWALFGCASVQTYYYYCNNKKDSRFLKSLVYFLYAWSTAQTFLYMHSRFVMLASGWGHRPSLNFNGTAWFAVPVMSGVSSAAVQCFYAWRVYRLSESAILGIFISLIALMEGVSGITLGFLINSRGIAFDVLQEKMFAVTSVWLLGSGICDIIVCTSMVYFLYGYKREPLTRNTESLLTRIIRLCVGAGVLTAAVAIVDAVLYLVYRHNNYHMVPAAVMEKVYINSLLVLLNNRHPEPEPCSCSHTAGGGPGWSNTPIGFAHSSVAPPQHEMSDRHGEHSHHSHAESGGGTHEATDFVVLSFDENNASGDKLRPKHSV